MTIDPIRVSDFPPAFESSSGDIRLGRRICLYGRGGKTSLSRALGDLTGMPVIELDAVFWLPNWVERDGDEILEIVRERIEGSPDGWIIDGNYSKIRPHILPLADTVIWLNLPTWSVTIRIVKRTIFNALQRNRICGDNYESFLNAIAPNSVIWFNAFGGKRSQKRVAEALRTLGFDANVYEIRSYRELREFYRSFKLDQKAHLT